MTENYQLSGRALFLDVLASGQNFQIQISIENYDSVRKQCEKLRNEVFVNELGYYQRTDKSQESDKYDKFALHIVSRRKLNIVGYCRLLPLEHAQFSQYYKKFGLNSDAIRAVEVTRFCLRKQWRKTRQILPLGVGVYLGAFLLNRNTIIASTPDRFKSIYLAIGGNILGNVNISEKHGDRQLFYANRDKFKTLLCVQKIIPELTSHGYSFLSLRISQVFSVLSQT